MDMLAGKGHWVRIEDRQPAAYGRYRVICMQRGQMTEDDYLWNGSYWVTPKGSPSKGVESWWEQTEETLPKSTQPAAPARTLTLADYEARIHLYKEQIGTGYIGIGRTLIEAKEAKVVPHGQWESWVTETTGLTVRQAQRCMQAATEIRDGSALARLEMSKALMLLGSGLDDEAREEIAEKAAEEGATVKALREEIRQTKLKLVQETGAATEIRDALKKVEAERESLAQQIRARESAYQARIDEAREDAYRRGMNDQAKGLEQDIRKEFQGKIDYINGERKQAEERIRSLQTELAVARNEGSTRWDEGYMAAQKEIAGLQNELNKQTQYAQDLRKALEERTAAPEMPEDYATDREILLAAAEDAEKRAAEAEAELESLRAGGAGQPDPAWKVLKVAMTRFLADCEMMPLDPAALIPEKARILANVTRLEKWTDMMRMALAGAVAGEGAVE